MRLVTRSRDPCGQLAWCLHAVRVGEQLGQLVPVGVVVEHQADHVASPAGAEVRRAEVLQRDHLVGLGPEHDAEQLVLATEDVGDGRPA